MDSMITAAGRALAAGDPLGALDRVALRDDAPALALRGIAMAQLGELARARLLLRRAARAFGPREEVARARCVVAEAEVALASRDLRWPEQALAAARATLSRRGDAINAAHADQLEVRRLLLIGRLDAAGRRLAALDPIPMPPPARAVHHLIAAGVALRRLRTREGRAELKHARKAAREAHIPALLAEVEEAARALRVPAARRVAAGGERLLVLEEVETLLASGSLVVDACRHLVRAGNTVVSLARRPVLFALVRALAEAWPADVPRDVLVARAFGGRRADASHRARLRVEAGRARVVLRGLATVSSTRAGFALAPRGSGDVVVIAPPVEGDDAAVLALLADGQAWSSSALALALGTSQRTAQRSLDALAEGGRVRSFGRGRARRWTSPPLPGITTTLLLPALPPGG